jgi:hypothetical protein
MSDRPTQRGILDLSDSLAASLATPGQPAVNVPAEGISLGGMEKFTDVATRQYEIQRRIRADIEEREASAMERVALLHQSMLPANERIAEHQRATAEAQRAAAEVNLAVWRDQAPARERMNAILENNFLKESKRIDDTFNTMFAQTRSAGHMFWITFCLGALLMLASVGTFMARPEAGNPLLAAFFGTGALSILAFFLRDPAEKVQRTGAKLVQLQVAMRYHLTEMQYWSTYFNGKLSSGQQVDVGELRSALSGMRDGMQVIMRQIDESLDDARGVKGDSRGSGGRRDPARGSPDPAPGS